MNHHGISISESATPTRTMNSVENNIVCVIGTAPLANAKPVLAYSYAEAVQQLGYSDDFDKYTLSESIITQFNLYSQAPAVFINVYNPDKHNKTIAKTFEGVSSFNIDKDFIVGSLAVTSGEFEEPTQLEKNKDFVVDSMYLHGQDNEPTIAIEFLNTDKIIDGKFKVSYRMTRDALGGEPTIEEVTVEELEDNIYELTDDTIIESVVVETGGVNTLVNLDYEVANATASDFAQVTILNEEAIVDNLVKVTYKKAAPELVTAADIIGGIDAETGQKYGLELVDDIFPKWNLVAGILIAPKFSTDISVATALARKAKSISDVFSGVAIADIPTDVCKTYAQAVEWKNENNLADTHLILCYPKVLAEGKQYHLSTHLAALMNRVDYNNSNIPFVSPSNQALEISASILEDGTEVFLNQGAANFLNSNGIVTVFSFGGGLRAWGNRLSIYPDSNDPKDVWISIRRMVNYIKTHLLTNYISTLDIPINRRSIDSILLSCNQWLAGLVTRNAMLGGELTFDETENPVSELLAGRICFNLKFAVPTPAESIEFKLEFNADYFETLFS